MHFCERHISARASCKMHFSGATIGEFKLRNSRMGTMLFADQI